MNEIEITVKHDKTEIKYRQTVRECNSFSATTIPDYSKANDRESLIETIRAICKEVKDISSQP